MLVSQGVDGSLCWPLLHWETEAQACKRLAAQTADGLLKFLEFMVFLVSKDLPRWLAWEKKILV